MGADAQVGKHRVLNEAVRADQALSQERTDIPERYRWNLHDVFADEGAFEAARERAAAGLPQLATFRGTLGSSPQALLGALETMTGLYRRLVQLRTYASQRRDEDTRLAKPQAMLSEIDQLLVRFAAESSYVRPELLDLDPARVAAFLEQEPRLAPYRDAMRRRIAGILSIAAAWSA